jgi:hypothetical protein
MSEMPKTIRVLMAVQPASKTQQEGALQHLRQSEDKKRQVSMHYLQRQSTVLREAVADYSSSAPA